MRRVAYIGSGDGYIAERRHEAMHANCAVEYVELVSGKRIRCRVAIIRLPMRLMRCVRLTALWLTEVAVFYSPQLAVGVLDAIKSSPWIQKKRVKYVLTFCRPGDVDMLRRFASDGVEIVTVQVDPAELASEAAAMLLEHIDNGSPGEPMIKKIQPTLHPLKDEKSKLPMGWHDY